MRFIIHILFNLFILSLSAQTNLNLIIGIGNYPTETECAQIHGDNDVPLVTESLVKIGLQKPHVKPL